jgi:two-component system, OmpR family, phosphate regulon response regulator PhoB
LIVEDDATLRLLVSATLRGEDVRVVEAADGEAGLTVAAQERPRLILLDIGLPRIDGIEVCRRLKSDPDLKATPVVMLTAMQDDAHKLAAGAAGADGYLTKPFSPLQLLQTVERYLT